MYQSAEIGKNIKKAAKARKILLKDMLSDLGLARTTLSNMYHGSMISADSLAEIADYLNCSVDYLLGREGPFETPRS